MGIDLLKQLVACILHFLHIRKYFYNPSIFYDNSI